MRSVSSAFDSGRPGCRGRLLNSTSLSVVALVFILQSALVGDTPAQAAPRERISITENWRFTKGDPSNLSESLLYNVRRARRPCRFAQQADGNAATNESVIKQWIFPTV